MASPESTTQVLDYDQMLLLDAEELAEQGMAEAYGRATEKLKRYDIELEAIQERVDDATGTYSVVFNGREHIIYGDLNDTDSWGNATVVFFEIINAQLSGSDIRFYALNGGNDLGGIVLSHSEYTAACEGIKTKQDWPYLPQHGDEWFGQPH